MKIKPPKAKTRNLLQHPSQNKYHTFIDNTSARPSKLPRANEVNEVEEPRTAFSRIIFSRAQLHPLYGKRLQAPHSKMKEPDTEFEPFYRPRTATPDHTLERRCPLVRPRVEQIAHLKKPIARDISACIRRNHPLYTSKRDKASKRGGVKITTEHLREPAAQGARIDLSAILNYNPGMLEEELNSRGSRPVSRNQNAGCTRTVPKSQREVNNLSALMQPIKPRNLLGEYVKFANDQPFQRRIATYRPEINTHPIQQPASQLEQSGDGLSSDCDTVVEHDCDNDYSHIFKSLFQFQS
eukprot:TRINITY_DN4476_c0_g1_i1.p1 TRINITY_DN4476_c0_g1~~TRINITY_DN4476_c0_g1_i1.p1  ORF type:complete len:296 (+),score=1.96 TRINITY_DN4476_c0_g1_i1:374-1261(+)